MGSRALGSLVALPGAQIPAQPAVKQLLPSPYPFTSPRCREILHHRPDVVCLQEVDHFPQFQQALLRHG